MSSEDDAWHEAEDLTRLGVTDAPQVESGLAEEMFARWSACADVCPVLDPGSSGSIVSPRSHNARDRVRPGCNCSACAWIEF